MVSININIQLQQDLTHSDPLLMDALAQRLLDAAEGFDRWSDSTEIRTPIMRQIREIIPDRKKTEIIRSMAYIRFKALKHVPTPSSEFTRVYTASKRLYDTTGSLKHVREFLSRSFYESNNDNWLHISEFDRDKICAKLQPNRSNKHSKIHKNNFVTDSSVDITINV